MCRVCSSQMLLCYFHSLQTTSSWLSFLCLTRVSQNHSHVTVQLQLKKNSNLNDLLINIYNQIFFFFFVMSVFIWFKRFFFHCMFYWWLFSLCLMVSVIQLNWVIQLHCILGLCVQHFYGGLSINMAVNITGKW